MNVEKILRNGYFDRLKIDGTLKAINESSGIVLESNNSFKDSLNNSSESYKNGIAQLKIVLVGEANNDINSLELNTMREDRAQSGMVQIEPGINCDRYIVAYSNILILKSDYAIPLDLKATGKTLEDAGKLAKTNDKLEVLKAALQLNDTIHKKYNYSHEYISIAIVDRVYVSPLFRQCGVSTWLHSNLADIINTYAMVFPTGIVMAYGDFSMEASELFDMSEKEYSNMLLKHYEKMGYTKLYKLRLPTFDKGSNILYKVLI